MHNSILRNTAIFYAVAFGTGFALLPMAFAWITQIHQDLAYELAWLALLSCVCVPAGMFIHSGLRVRLWKIRLPYEQTSYVLFGLFLCFIIMCFVTSEKIPLIAALQGADAERLIYLRERFLKARQGWQLSLVYINALFAGGLIPYIICVGFEKKVRYRYVQLLIFFVYTISFVEKAFFLKIALPFFLLYLIKSKRKAAYLCSSISIILAMLLAMTVIAQGTEGLPENGESFYTAQYAAQTPLERIVWRSFVIPVVTSMDALRVFHETYNNTPLHGATNATLAFLFGLKRVEYERQVFDAQYGQNEFGTGSANSAFLTEAYVNYGWPGVVVFSLIVGKILYVLLRSKEVSIKAMSLPFLFSIFNSGLLSTLLSNGYLVLLVIAELVVWEHARRNQSGEAVRMAVMNE